MKKNGRMHFRHVCLLLAVVWAGIYVAGILLPDSLLEPDYLKTNISPCLAYPFGTDALGRNLLFRILKGLSISISIGVVASIFSGCISVLFALGTSVGSKKLDGFLSWVIDLFMSVPHTVLVLLISFVLGKGFRGLVAGIVLTHWCSLARVLRAEVMELRTQPYIQISKNLGKSDGWIVLHHYLPVIYPQLITGMILLFPHAILHEASISFLGFGLSNEQPSIGILLSESLRYLSGGMWWTAVLPGIALVLQVFLVDAFASALRKVLDPFSAQQ